MKISRWLPGLWPGNDRKMTERISHYLLTRFNVRLTFDVAPGSRPTGHMGLDAGWLERRFGLFEKYCLPSVAAQTRKDFIWLVYLDEETPQVWKDRMAELASEHEFLRPRYCRSFSDEVLWRGIDEEGGAEESIRITSRLDNDDMIHPAYMARMRELAERELAERQAVGEGFEKGFYLAFPLGYCLRDGAGYVQRYRNNPFSSYVSAASLRKTVLDVDHRYIAESAPVAYEWHRPLWCQLIHGENVANAVRGVYNPFGGVFERMYGGGPKRSVGWKLKEFFRSANEYLFHRNGK